jgi:putative ABC transport system permease protein
VPILRGRDFTEADLIATPWRAILSRRVAERLWPGEDPIGRTIVLWQGPGNTQGEVVGVAGVRRDQSLVEEPSLTVYLPILGARAPPTTLVVHAAGTTADLAPRLRAMVRELDATIPVSQVQSLDQRVSHSVASRRFVMVLLLGFAGVALLLSLAGVYGVLSYSISRRTSEIGVRLALGATPTGVLGFIVARGMRPVVAGVALGIGGAWLLSRLMEAMLFGIPATDAATYAGVAALLAGAAALACYVPARRALTLDVVAALRRE